MKLTLNQKRFLIVWILFHSFALFVNLAYIRGEIDINDNHNTGTDGSNNRLRDTSTSVTLYLFTSGEKKGFWPFTSYYYEEPRTVKAPTFGDYLPHKTDTSSKHYISLEDAAKYADSNPQKNVLPQSTGAFDTSKVDGSPIIEQVIGVSHAYYGGLFNSYGFAEYIFYIVLGLVIIFVPKLWK